ncbi:MAG: hypothetical protein J6S61_05900 [Elusimicrobiaceae bacterium]|nr:hypothetical protein [Elusimicrobiaceae bacterium]
MKKIISLSSVLAMLISQAGCILGKNQKPQQEVSFPYATQNIKQELAKKVFRVEKPVAEDFFETIDYMHIMLRMKEEGPSIFGEKEEQQVFWYYLMRLRISTLHYTFLRSNNEGTWAIFPYIWEYLKELSGHASKFVDEHPEEGQAILTSVIEYEEKYPYNPQKSVDERKNKIRNKIKDMTREEFAKTCGISLEKLNKVSDNQFEQLKQSWQEIKIEEDDKIKDIPKEFQKVRQEILQQFKNDLERIKKGESLMQYGPKDGMENGDKDNTTAGAKE